MCRNSACRAKAEVETGAALSAPMYFSTCAAEASEFEDQRESACLMKGSRVTTSRAEVGLHCA